MQDPYIDNFTPTNEDGHGTYSGLYVWPHPGPVDDPKTRYVISKMVRTWNGGMREFINPIHGYVEGCCGDEWAKIHVLEVEDWLSMALTL